MDKGKEIHSNKNEKTNYLRQLKYKLIKETYCLVKIILLNEINEEIIDIIEVRIIYL
jgi:hypothetical protein